jgi:hypothetical protein
MEKGNIDHNNRHIPSGPVNRINHENIKHYLKLFRNLYGESIKKAEDRKDVATKYDKGKLFGYNVLEELLKLKYIGFMQFHGRHLEKDVSDGSWCDGNSDVWSRLQALTLYTVDPKGEKK